MNLSAGPEKGWRAESPQVSRTIEGLARFSVPVALTFFFLIVLEIGSFLLLRFLSIATRNTHPRYEVLSAYRGERWAAALAREQEASARLDYRPYIVWQRRPYRGEAVVIEEGGSRRTFHSQCEDRAYTIWMFGGSTLWGLGSPDWGTIPSSLAWLYEKAGRTVCVRNYGEDAWVSTQEVIALMLELKRAVRKPDLVVFYDGANDVYIPYQSGRVDVHMNFDFVRDELERENAIRSGGVRYLRQSNTGQLILTLATLLAPPTHSTLFAGANRGSLARAAVANYLQNIDLVEAMARHYGFEYAFFWQPLVFTGHKPLTLEEERIRGAKSGAPPEAWCHQVYELMRLERRPNLFDLEDAFDKTRDSVFLNWCHITMNGNLIIATRMYQSLMAR